MRLPDAQGVWDTIQKDIPRQRRVYVLVQKLIAKKTPTAASQQQDDGETLLHKPIYSKSVNNLET